MLNAFAHHQPVGESSSLLESSHHSYADKHHQQQHHSLGNQLSLWAKQCLGVLIGVMLGIALCDNFKKEQSTPAMTTSSSLRPDPAGNPTAAATAAAATAAATAAAAAAAAGTATTSRTNSKYTSFQALNLQLYTGGAPMYLDPDNETVNPECIDPSSSSAVGAGLMDDEPVTQCYKAHDNITKDVHDRLAIMASALDRAYESSTKDPSVLKIFVAPEFFFRGKQGAYVVKEMDQSVFDEVNGTCGSEICHILEGLEDMVSYKKFEDWIFLFGTLIVSEALPKEDAYDYLFYNFGLLYKGYDRRTTSHVGKRFLVPKRYVSTSDFLTPNRGATVMNQTQEIFETARSEILDKQQQQQQQQQQQGSSMVFPHNKKYDRSIWYKYKHELTKLDYIMVEYGWLQIDGITLTVEICLDHDMRTALTSYLVDSVLPDKTPIPSTGDSGSSSGDDDDDIVRYVEMPRHQAQLSIVSSAGMEVSETSMALAHTGYIILQDGLSSAPPSMSWEYECFKYEWQFKGGAEVIQRNATLTPTEVVFHYHIHDAYKKIPVFSSSSTGDHDNNHWKTQLRGVFSNSLYEPMITAFSPMPIAEVF